MRKAMLHAPTRSPIWLSHHWPDRHDRCVRVSGVAVCRRCLVLYPLVLLAALVVLAVDLPLGAIVVAAWILPLPMSLEWAGEQFGVLAHSPRRLVVTTAVAALGLGAALAVHLRTPFHLDVRWWRRDICVSRSAPQRTGLERRGRSSTAARRPSGSARSASCWPRVVGRPRDPSRFPR